MERARWLASEWGASIDPGQRGDRRVHDTHYTVSKKNFLTVLP